MVEELNEADEKRNQIWELRFYYRSEHLSPAFIRTYKMPPRAGLINYNYYYSPALYLTIMSMILNPWPPFPPTMSECPHSNSKKTQYGIQQAPALGTSCSPTKTGPGIPVNSEAVPQSLQVHEQPCHPPLTPLHPSLTRHHSLNQSPNKIIPLNQRLIFPRECHNWGLHFRPRTWLSQS